MPEATQTEERTAAECTVTLEVNDAEKVCAEVDAGQHQTFDDALHYIIERGLAEIKRSRDSLAKLKQQRNDANAMANLRKAIANNPSFATDPTKLGDLMKALGVKL